MWRCGDVAIGDGRRRWSQPPNRQIAKSLNVFLVLSWPDLHDVVSVELARKLFGGIDADLLGDAAIWSGREQSELAGLKLKSCARIIMSIFKARGDIGARLDDVRPKE